MWESLYAQRVNWMKSSTIRELLKNAQGPEFISFAGGLPAPELFPIKEIDEASHKVLIEGGTLALQYGPTEGYQPLREWIAQYMSTENLHISADNVLVTTGSQQALDLLGKVFLDEGDTVLVDSPTFMGAIQAWTAYGVKYRTVPTDGDGVIIEELDHLLQARPKWIYAMPNFQNPTGLTLNLKRRQQLVEATSRYDIPLLEDDPYYRLRFEGEHLPSLLQLASNIKSGPSYGENTIYLGTFSKIMAPGLRVGWVIAPAEVIGKLVQAKQGVDLQSSTFTQMLANEIARSDFFNSHIERIRSTYHERRDIMLNAMQEHFPEWVSWTVPEGGMFLWVTMPKHIDANTLLVEAITNKVTFIPGDAFFPLANVKNTMRLNFSNASPDMIKEGIARLGRAFRNAQETNSSEASVVA